MSNTSEVKSSQGDTSTSDFIGDPFKDANTPLNVPLRGTFKKSFAYYTLKERVPIILTKVIDYLSREGEKIKLDNNATDADIIDLIHYISKLKNDLVTNKKYDFLTVDTDEAKRWNQCIQGAEYPYFFNNIWVFSECYVYRRLREGCELSKGLKDFDPFEHQKKQAFLDGLEAMRVVANKLVTMLQRSEKATQKSDFITLLKICLWSNKCDLSLSMGEQVIKVVDPFRMILEFEDKLLADDTVNIAEQVIMKAENMENIIKGNRKKEIETSEELEGPKSVMFDIVCDNAGYELFADLCLAHFLVTNENIVQKVRFHVKKIPWFVSDVTPRDFKYLINACAQASFSKDITGSTGDTPKTLNSENLKLLGETWMKFYEDGTFVVMCDDFWTSPHVYKDMKRYDPQLYRKLQFAVAVLFKGDLNYRKLLGDVNFDPVLDFTTALQGFMPAPVIALRTIKADLICGLPKGKWEHLNEVNEKWMETGDYGVIQFCSKHDPIQESCK